MTKSYVCFTTIAARLERIQWRLSPTVMMMSSQAERYAVLGKSHTSSHTRITANRPHRNQGPQPATASKHKRQDCDTGTCPHRRNRLSATCNVCRSCFSGLMQPR